MYIEIYNEFISQLCIYAKAVRILAKGYLPIPLINTVEICPLHWGLSIDQGFLFLGFGFVTILVLTGPI